VAWAGNRGHFRRCPSAAFKWENSASAKPASTLILLAAAQSALPPGAAAPKLIEVTGE
jgi:hypothetical protein